MKKTVLRNYAKLIAVLTYYSDFFCLDFFIDLKFFCANW